MRNTFIEALCNEAKVNPKIMLMTGDLGFGVLDNYIREFPNQFLNCGVTEQSMMSVAAGYASMGYQVFVYSIGNFPTLRCLEQIRNDICYMNNPVVVVSVGAGFSYGAQGYSHHAIEEVSAMRALPNIDICVPADSYEVKAVSNFIFQSRKPAYLRLGKGNEPTLHSQDLEVVRGKAIPLEHGRDGTILFNGAVGDICLAAKINLQLYGYDLSVMSIPILNDLEEGQLRSIAEKGPILVVEEHTTKGGLGSEVLEKLSEFELQHRTKLIGTNPDFIKRLGSQMYLRNLHEISISRITTTFLSLAERLS